MITETEFTPDETRAVRNALRAAEAGMTVGAAPVLRSTSRGVVRRPLLVAAAVFALVVAVSAFLQPWHDRSASPTSHPTSYPTSYPGTDPAKGGHLVRDQAWLGALPQQAADQLSTGDRRVHAADVRVAVAADVAGWDGTPDQARFALVRWPTAHGTASGWLVGPGHAPVTAMSVTGSSGPKSFTWSGFGPGSSGVEGTGSGVVVAAPPGSTVVVRGANDVTAAGGVKRLSVQAAEYWDGIFVAALPSAAGRLDVAVTTGGRTLTDWAYSGSSQDLDAWWATASKDARGIPVSDGLTVRADLASAVMQATLLPLTDGSRVLWSDSTMGPGGDVRTDSAVLAIRGASGGWALVSVERHQPSTTSFEVTVTAVRTVGAQAPDDLALAWRRVGEPADTGRVDLLGPPSATRARMDTPDGTVFVELEDGAATGASVPGATVVRFLDVDDRVVATTTISPVWQQGKPLGQASPPT